MKSLKFSTSSQDYLEAILELSYEHAQIRSIDLSEKMGVTRASINRAVGVLKALGFITHEKYSDIVLTEEGRRAAIAVKVRHTTLKSFLEQILGVGEDIAEIDACRMEHSVSLETLEKLRNFMEKQLK